MAEEKPDGWSKTGLRQRMGRNCASGAYVMANTVPLLLNIPEVDFLFSCATKKCISLDLTHPLCYYTANAGS